MNCRECGSEIEEYFNVLLCDRCLKARCWEILEEDDIVLLRRKPNGDLHLDRGINGGKQFTNLTILKLDPMTETIKAIGELLGA